MVTFSSGNPQPESFGVELKGLTALVADMEAIARGALPEELAGAEPPVLDLWVNAARLAPCLIGRASGHPRLPGQGRLISTSEVWLIDAEQGWARSWSRWYRLGRPGDAPSRLHA